MQAPPPQGRKGGVQGEEGPWRVWIKKDRSALGAHPSCPCPRLQPCCSSCLLLPGLEQRHRALPSSSAPTPPHSHCVLASCHGPHIPNACSPPPRGCSDGSSAPRPAPPPAGLLEGTRLSLGRAVLALPATALERHVSVHACVFAGTCVHRGGHSFTLTATSTLVAHGRPCQGHPRAGRSEGLSSRAKHRAWPATKQPYPGDKGHQHLCHEQIPGCQQPLQTWTGLYVSLGMA